MFHAVADITDRSFDDPHVEFHLLTGLELPREVTILASGDNHGGMSNEGECFFILETNPQDIEPWLKSSPPWGKAWLPTPVPEDVAWEKFAYHDRDYKIFAEDANKPGAFYCAEDFAQSDLSWHNGRLLIVNPASGRVYMSWWDR